ncbi:MAG: hypothetical protein ACTSWF_03710, partial [Candidatus Freyarchaeota archaeon]
SHKPSQHEDDQPDDMITVREELCIGCGLYSSNCPNDATTLEKVRNTVPVKTQAELEEKIKTSKTH